MRDREPALPGPIDHRGASRFAICVAVLLLSGGRASSAQAEERARAPLQRPPVVTIQAHRTDKGGAVSLEIEVLSPSGEPFEIRPLIDNLPAAGFTLAKARNLAASAQYTLTVPLPARDCVLSVVAQTPSGQSEPAVLRLRRAGTSVAVEERPALHVLAVGIGAYQDRDIAPLNYPAKDARDLAATLKNQRDSLYRDIEARVLLDGEATRQRIEAELAGLQGRAAAADTTVIFLAGHGTSDPDGNYYYLPYEARAGKETLLSGADLQALLHGIQGKVVLLLDTCHSGNVLGKGSLRRLLNDLASENSVVVFAASTGAQTSRESSAWANGAFTKALVEGLRGVADYAEDGHISMSELETWVSLRVKELTGGAQTPTLAKPNAAPDYVVASLPRSSILLNPRQAHRRRILWGVLGAAAGVAAAAVVLGAVLGTQLGHASNSVDLNFAGLH